jgi:putative ABC transport system substrate-binding protein
MLVTAAALALAPRWARAQPRQHKIPTVGFLISETVAGSAERVDALRAGLRERGYVEGGTIAIETRAADGDYQRLPALASALVRLGVDVLVTFGTKATAAATQATAWTPIVFVSVGDPIALGYARDLGHPGGNVTGLGTLSPLIVPKRLELMKEAVPGIGRLAVVINPVNPSAAPVSEAMNVTAAQLHIELKRYEVRDSADLDRVFATLAKTGVDGVVVSADTLFRSHDRDVAALAIKHRLPSVGSPEFAQAGGLVGYGVDNEALFRRGAYFVDRILRGARPADLPIEQPTRFELVVNLKAARALGIAIPPPLRIRADRVID